VPIEFYKLVSFGGFWGFLSFGFFVSGAFTGEK
jgi:hypothetical protein